MPPQNTPQNLTARILQNISRVAADDWKQLNGSVFTDWTFLGALEDSKTVANVTGWKPQHLVLESDGKLVAAAPMYLKSHSGGEFVFDHSWASAAEQMGISYYPKGLVAAPLSPVTGPRVLVAPGFDAGLAARVLGALASDLTRDLGLSGVHWLFLTEEEAARLSGIGYGTRLGIQYHWFHRGYTRFDDWMDEFKSKRRRTMRRERKDLAALGLTIDILEGDQLDDDAMRLAFRLYKTTIDKKVWGRQYLNEDFFIRLGRTWREHLLLILARDPATNDVIAGSFFIHGDGVLYGRYWGCFTEVPFLHFELSYYKPIELCIERGWTRFEAGAQGEHKYERGFAPMLTYSAHKLHNPRLGRAVAQFLEEEGQAMRAELEQMRAQSPSRAVQAMAQTTHKTPSPD